VPKRLWKTAAFNADSGNIINQDMPKVLLLTVLLLRWPLLAQPDCTRPSNVVRLDPSNKRLFAVGTDDQISTSGRARNFLTKTDCGLRFDESVKLDWGLEGKHFYGTEIRGVQDGT